MFRDCSGLTNSRQSWGGVIKWSGCIFHRDDNLLGTIFEFLRNHFNFCEKFAISLKVYKDLIKFSKFYQIFSQKVSKQLILFNAGEVFNSKSQFNQDFKLLSIIFNKPIRNPYNFGKDLDFCYKSPKIWKFLNINMKISNENWFLVIWGRVGKSLHVQNFSWY